MRDGLQCMLRVSEDFKMDKNAVERQLWHQTITLKKREHARWYGLHDTFQEDDATRLRILYYCLVATGWFPHPDVDVLRDARPDIPCFSVRDSSSANPCFRGRIVGFDCESKKTSATSISEAAAKLPVGLRTPGEAYPADLNSCGRQCCLRRHFRRTPYATHLDVSPRESRRTLRTSASQDEHDGRGAECEAWDHQCGSACR